MEHLNHLTDSPHRRYNPLIGEWVLVSPHRTKRPWQGKLESNLSDERPPYDPGCYLCPGNERVNGGRNPKYSGTFVFDNDFSALLPDIQGILRKEHPLISHEAVRGISRVLCFSPRHDLTLPLMDREDILEVIDRWAEETSELGKKYRWVQIFENKGEIMGCSNPHPHCQIWASTSLPNEPSKENVHQRSYWRKYNRPLLRDYLRLEEKHRERLLLENDAWSVVVPFWAVWPFETLLLPRRHVLRFPDLIGSERSSLAEILKSLTTKYDNLFNISFPYTMGWHGAPFGMKDASHWQLHAHFYPPLLRSATVKKFMVGYEMLSEPQRDITAEQAAQRLKQVPDIHYTIAGIQL
jgi:UDPglucose--hexose-1-phosphate uridylyltransferase